MVHFAQSNSPGFRTLSSAKESPSGVDLVRLGKWLLSLSGQDQGLLRHTREFRDFIDATRRLEKAQRNLEVWNAMNDTSTTKDGSVNSKCSFLQYVVSDESVLCVLDYLESYSLVQIATTCTRLRNLAYQNARIRCKGIESERQLTDVMHLLRAKEQIEGLDWESDFLLNSIVRSKPATFPSVRIPALLPGRRVLVTGAGDLEFNGVYFCTGCNGNGFVFTKPRYPFQRIPERERNSIQDGEMSREPPNLNCIFARRFSGQV